MIDYPLFAPPEHLAAKQAKQWSKKEAQEYKDWLMSVIDCRVDFLINFLGVSKVRNIENLLDKCGNVVAELLWTEDFSEKTNDSLQLNNRGYALAADMGLLVAKSLLKFGNDKIYWNILKKPKTELSYNLPVLEGFSACHLDPIGGSIAEATSIFDGEGGGIWKEMFVFWKDRIG